jgi:hypothetical protein
MSDLVITRGDSPVLDVAALEPDGVTPQTLLGATVRFTAKRDLNEPYALATIRKDTGAIGGVTITNAPMGLAEVALEPADTEDLPNVRCELFYDVQATDSGGAVMTLARGLLIVLPDVTNP